MTTDRMTSQHLADIRDRVAQAELLRAMGFDPLAPDVLAAVEDADREEQITAELRERREHLGLSMTEVAHRMGASTRSVAEFEQPDSAPYLSQMFAYARALGGRIRIEFDPESED